VNPFETFVVSGIGLLAAGELLDSGFRRRLRRPDERLRRNLAYLAATLVSLGCVHVISDFAQRHGLTLVHWSGRIPLQIACCFAVVELLGWLLHYVKHVNGFLWAFHVQHHLEEHFDIWLSTHTHALEVVTSTVIIATTTTLLGFAPLVTELYVAVYTVVKVFQHSARDYSLGWFDRVVVGPRYHRLHHEVGSRCNYAVTLTLFDVLFRTARWPSPTARREPVGVVAPGVPFGFWREMTLFLARSPGARRLTRRARLGSFAGPPS
jgi:sterol desaturase/sphingolipid hydroxylase (fatty acid hydroxylase superfamily)